MIEKYPPNTREPCSITKERLMDGYVRHQVTF